MTEIDNATSEETPEATEGQETPETPDPAPETPEEPNPNKEAAKYRVRLREAEAELERARERVSALEARELAAMASDLLQADDLSRFVNVDDLRDESGALDAERVKAAIDELKTARPYLFAEQSIDIGQGKTGATAAGPSWSEAIRG